MDEQVDQTILTLTADIVAAHVGHNRIGTEDLPALIANVHAALTGLDKAPAEETATEQKPAVPIRSSVKPDYIVCLEDGRKLTMLKRYLQTRYNMTPQQYRQKWKLPADYPMVAPNYADRRRDLAKAMGLGQKVKASDTPAAANHARAK